MVMTNRVSTGADSQTFGGLQLRVAVLCGLIQALDGYDLSASGSPCPRSPRPCRCRRPPSPRPSRSPASASWWAPCWPFQSRPLRPQARAAALGSRCSAVLAALGVGAFLADPGGAALFIFTGIGNRWRHADDGGAHLDYTPDRWRTSVVMFCSPAIRSAASSRPDRGADPAALGAGQGIFQVGGIVPLVLLVVLIFILPESPQFQRGARPASARRIR